MALSLLDEVKNELRITWNEEDLYITSMIERGISYIENLVGVELDFEKNDEPKSLLLNYCRYDYDNALDLFETNYALQIRRLILKEGVKSARKETKKKNS